MARGDFYRIRYDVDRQQKLVTENQILAALKDAELIDDDHRLIKDNVTTCRPCPVKFGRFITMFRILILFLPH